MSRWYYWVAGFFLLDTLSAFGFLSRIIYGTWAGKSGDPVTQTLNLLLIASSLTLFGYGFRQSKKGFATGSVLALSAVGFLCLSSLWSMAPDTTFRVAIVYLYVILGAIGVARTMDADEYMRLLSWCCFLSAIASVLLLVALPSNALMVTYDSGSGGARDFIGIFSHKNALGQVMSIGALATLYGIRVARRRYVGKLCMLFAFVGMAYASKSTAALLAALLYCGVSGLDSLWRKGGAARLTGVILSIFLAPVLIVAVVAPDTILELIGKDPTLTGRTEIWAYVIPDIWMKPWLGWGYFGFWQLTNPAAFEISNAVHWVVPHAHNGLLESLLEIGVLGTALFAFILIRIIVLAIRCLDTPERPLAISTISCCAGILALGVSEPVLIVSIQSSTPVLFISGLMCERAVQAAKRRYRSVRGSDRIGLSGKECSGKFIRQGYRPASFVA